MSSPSTIHGIPIPAGGDDNDSVAAIAAVIASLESGSIIRRLSQAQIDALTGPQKPAGLAVFNTTAQVLQVSDGTNFRDVPSLASSGGWQSWTPVLTQGGTVAWNAGTSRARYLQVGKTVHAVCRLEVTGNGTFNNAVKMTLPVTAAAAISGGGTFWHFDTGNANFTGFVSINTPTELLFYHSGGNQAYGANNSVTVSNGDVFHMFITYEAA